MREEFKINISKSITSLVESAYAEGLKAGREEGLKEAAERLADLQSRFLEPPKRIRTRREPEPPAPDQPIATNAAIILVEEALKSLAPDAPDGVYPESLAEETHLKPREIRAALRRMTATGQCRRLARGKYLPASPPDPATLIYPPNAAE